MGSGVALPFSYSKVFEDVFPYYMAMGMSYEQFWNDNPKLAYYYRKAHEIKLQQSNEQMWLQGMYMAYAINSTVGNMFKKKSQKPNEYPSEPLPITQEQIEEKKRKEAIRKQEEIKARFMKLALSVNANLSKKKGG